MGLTSELVRLRSLTENGWQPGARARFVMYGADGSGWGPSLSVTGVTNSTTLVIASDRHSGAQTVDAEGFKILATGDEVLLHAIGDMDNATKYTITALTDTAITLSSAHGLTASGANVIGFVVPMRSAVATVPTPHAVYGYIGGVTIT